MRRVYLSMGHDINSQGAEHNGVTEFALAARVLQYIDHPRIHVFERTLRDTVDYINEADDVALAVELHFNSSADPAEPSGCETLYCPWSEVGGWVAQAYHDTYMTRERQAGEDTRDRGYKEGIHYSGAGLYFLNKTRCPALILEPEFLQHCWEWSDHGCRLAAAHIEAGLLAALDVLET